MWGLGDEEMTTLERNSMLEACGEEIGALLDEELV
jgi:hypothetical protein